MKKIWDLIEKILKFIVYKILRMDLSEEKWESFLQFVKFGIVGLSNNVICYVVYLILIHFNVHYVLADIAGFSVSVINSFYWNNRYVFKTESQRTWWKAFLKTYISYAGSGIVVSNILLIFWIEVCHIPEFIAPIVSLIVTIPVNFLLNKFWAFKDEK